VSECDALFANCISSSSSVFPHTPTIRLHAHSVPPPPYVPILNPLSFDLLSVTVCLRRNPYTEDFLKLRDEPRAADALATFRENSPSRKAEGISHVVIRVHIDGLCGPSGGAPGAPGETGFNGTPHSVWRRVRVATNLTMARGATRGATQSTREWNGESVRDPTPPRLKLKLECDNIPAGSSRGVFRHIPPKYPPAVRPILLLPLLLFPFSSFFLTLFSDYSPNAVRRPYLVLTLLVHVHAYNYRAVRLVLIECNL
jgi:hypothetical protein